MCFFHSNATDVNVKILVSILDKKTFQCALIFYSIAVTELFHNAALFLDEPIIAKNVPTAVLAVDLLWLRWNEDPENAKNLREGYSYVSSAGNQRFLEDLDTVGNVFVESIFKMKRPADFLLVIDSYPIKIKWGGRPVSADAIMFSSIIYIADGDKERALNILDSYLAESLPSEEAPEWLKNRYQRIRERRRLIQLYLARA